MSYAIVDDWSARIRIVCIQKGHRLMALSLCSVVRCSLSPTITAAIRSIFGRSILFILSNTYYFHWSILLILSNTEYFRRVDTIYTKQ